MGKKHRGKKIIASNIRDQRVDRDSKKNTVKETEVQKKKVSYLCLERTRWIKTHIISTGWLVTDDLLKTNQITPKTNGETLHLSDLERSIREDWSITSKNDAGSKEILIDLIPHNSIQWEKKIIEYFKHLTAIESRASWMT